MAFIIPPPVQSPVADENDKMSSSWYDFWTRLFTVSGAGADIIKFTDEGVESSGDLNLESNVGVRWGDFLFSAPTSSDVGKVLSVDGSNNIVYLQWGTDIAALPSGTIKQGFFGTTPPTGYILLNDGTIGNASSGATNRANADTEDLFTVLWNNISNTYCPVSGGRGASAAADFAAGKTIQLPLTRGRALGVAGAGSGLTSRATGETAGAETVALTTANLPSHLHSGSIYNISYLSVAAAAGSSTTDILYPTVATDSDEPHADPVTAHNNMQPSQYLTLIMKL